MIELTYGIVFALCILLGILIKSQQNYWIKFFAVILSITAFASVFLAIENYTSLPVKGPPSGQVQIYAVIVSEPNSFGHETGIWLWARKLESNSPKTHRIDYSKELHEKINEIEKKLKKGQSVYIDTKNLFESDKDTVPPNGSFVAQAIDQAEKAWRNMTQGVNKHQAWEFQFLNIEPNLPPKN